MVTFKLVEENGYSLIYHYFPNGEENSESGIIVIDKKKNQIYVKYLSPKDFMRTETIAEQNELRDSVNEMRKIEGLGELSEEEWPIATEDIVVRFFADHAVNKIWDGYVKGDVLQSGTVMWY